MTGARSAVPARVGPVPSGGVDAPFPPCPSTARSTTMSDHPCPEPGAKLTIRVYTARADGTRVQVSFRTSDEPIGPAPLSPLTWPACRCPRCGDGDGGGERASDAA